MIDMFRKKPILKYESAVDIYPNIIAPAKNHVPEWYKKIPKWKNNEIFKVEEGFGHSMKLCMPFLDSLTSGYMILLPNDLYVKNQDGAPYLTWKDAEFPPKWRKDVSNPNIVPSGHFPLEYTWQISVAYTIPQGYSMLVTHPFNRSDLPFTTLTGIVDGGLVMSHIGSLPFYIKEGFEGIIPQGTPIAQILPFCKQDWSSRITKGLVKDGEKHNKSSLRVISGWYKKTFWARKNYN
jgi:hypothetical protein